MRRTGGLIPPGKAGLVMLAVAFAPLALAACKPLARGLGKFLKKAGEMAERVADSSQIDAQEEVKTETVAEPKKAAAPKKATPRKKAAPKSKPADAAP